MITAEPVPGTEFTAVPGGLRVRHPDRGSVTGPFPELPVLLTPAVAEDVQRLARWGLVRYVQRDADGREQLSATLTSELGFLTPAAPAASVMLSRFAILRAHEGALVAESPVSGVRVAIADPPIAARIAALAQPGPADGLELLAAAGILVDPAVPEPPALRQRELHDLLAHTSSRRGLTPEEVGAAYPFLGELDPEPALSPGFGGPVTPLPAPDLDELQRSDPPLALVMERRRSIRHYGADPVSVAQLGEFLYRVARARESFEVAASDEVAYEVTGRPLPAGGGTHDLEFYVTAVRCAGLPAGMYHYRPAQHALELVTADPKWVVAMANEAYRCAGSESVPQVLVTLASRFARLTWKYRGIAHALSLKHTGVAYQAMYLAATAMDLAPCALGHGNAALFARATGLDPLTESSVGEFLLGTKGPTP